MTTVRELHNQAMKLSDRSLMAKHVGESADALSLARQALELEREAATLLPKKPEFEPTRSILYRSAATLAFDTEDFADASRLTFEGLSGYPPEDVRAELFALFERIKFAEQFGFRDTVMESASIELTLSGNDVSYGLVPFDILRERVTAMVDLYRRNSDRLTGSKFRASGPQLKTNPFQPFVRAFQPGSFKVAVALGYKRNETRSYLLSNDDVVADVMKGIRLVHEQDWVGLADLIPDSQYFENFANLVRSLAPDGQRVSLVGLAYKSESIAYSRTRIEHDPPDIGFISPSIAAVVEKEPTETHARYIGELKHFDERESDRYMMSVVTEQQESISFSYSVSMIDTIRSVLGEPVEVLLLERGGNRTLVTIDPVS